MILIAARVAIGVALLITGPGWMDYSDRIAELEAAPGAPWVDHPVEYAPVEYLFIRVIGSADEDATARRIVLAAFVGDMLTFAAVRRRWGARAATSYLLLGTPLLVFLYARFDTVVLASVMWGLALPRGPLVALGGLARVWPIVVVPALPRRERLWAALSLVVGVAVWILLTTPDALRQVATFRGATGFQFESPAGVLAWILSGEPLRLEVGAMRVGEIPEWGLLLLFVALLATLLLIWLRPTRDPAGSSSLAAVAAILTFSPAFSLQYAAWLAPFGAIAWREDRSAGRLTFVVMILTALDPLLIVLGQALGLQILLIVRACLIGALVVRGLRPKQPPAREP
jgi:hypothetical protein